MGEDKIEFIRSACGKLIKVDEDIFEKYGEYTWWVSEGGSVFSNQTIKGRRGRNIRSLILDYSEKYPRRPIRHIDGDPLNFTRANLSRTNVVLSEFEEGYKATLPNGKSFLIDKIHEDVINSRTWHFDSGGYVVHRSNGKVEFLHRVLTEAPKGKVVDHINHDKTDNRLTNLRVVKPSENTFNRKGAQSNSLSGIRGVHSSKEGKWVVRFVREGVTDHLGTYESIKDAERMAKEYLEGVLP